LPYRQQPAAAHSLTSAGVILIFLAGTPAVAWTESGAPAKASDANAIDDSETRLFAPIPRWEPPPAPVDAVLATPSFLAPTLDKQGAARNRAVHNGLARPAIRATPIRRGLGTTPSRLPAASERAVGMQLGAERLSVSTAIVTGQGGWQRNDTRLDWNVARGATSGSNVLWSATAGGNLQASGSAEQNAQAVLGYRLQPLDIVTLTTEIALASTYSFAAENGLSSNVTPRVKVIADLTQPLSTPWRTTLDLDLGRQVSLSDNSLQTNASALLRLELPTP